MEILVENPKFCQKWKYWSKIQSFVKNFTAVFIYKDKLSINEKLDLQKGNQGVKFFVAVSHGS